MTSQEPILRRREFIHFRGRKSVTNKDGVDRETFTTKGGATVCYDPLRGANRYDVGSCAIGVSVCSPQENFNRKRGRTESLSNARFIAGTGGEEGPLTREEFSEKARIEVAKAVGRIVNRTGEIRTEKARVRYTKELQRISEYRENLSNLSPKPRKEKKEEKVAV